MRKIWHVKPAQDNKYRQIAAALEISPVLAQLLFNRGIEEAREADRFLRADLEDCHDPFLLKDMEKAAERVRRALAKKEKIVVYGDYDVDGLTSCALLHNALTRAGGVVSCYVPHRLEEGYGLNSEACAGIKKQGASLVITVDCGISSFAETGFLTAAGIDTIITDHHQPLNNRVPAALAVINPRQKDCAYPYKELAGVGLAYKLAQAVLTGNENIKEHLDLVAMGTISDVAPLTGENRIFARHGLEALARTNKTGLKALMAAAKINGNRRLSVYHVGFILGPRLNAAGRMGSAEKALQLLLSDDYAQAYQFAQFLDQENRRRQRVEDKILKQALEMAAGQINFKHHRCVVLHHDDWHPGVVGIVASRIAERFYRPTILISTKEKIGKGSGRSIRNFHLFEALRKCGHVLEEFGGHENAAGLSILRENLDVFKEMFNETAHEKLTAEDLIPVVDIDMDIPLSALSENLLAELERCEPFGMGNPRPVFVSHNLKLKSSPRACGRNGFKMWVTDDNTTCEAIISRVYDDGITRLNGGFSLVYSPSLNDWQGLSTIQLQLKDFRAC